MPPIGHMDWIGFGSAFRLSLWIGLDWVKELIDWIGLDLENWTHVQLYNQSRLPKLKSLAQVVLKICPIVCQKLWGHVTWGHFPYKAVYQI